MAGRHPPSPPPPTYFSHFSPLYLPKLGTNHSCSRRFGPRAWPAPAGGWSASARAWRAVRAWPAPAGSCAHAPAACACVWGSLARCAGGAFTHRRRHRHHGHCCRRHRRLGQRRCPGHGRRGRSHSCRGCRRHGSRAGDASRRQQHPPAFPRPASANGFPPPHNEAQLRPRRCPGRCCGGPGPRA